jgi:eukaryotic-like serine/threonine-protein kinase
MFALWITLIPIGEHPKAIVGADAFARVNQAGGPNQLFIPVLMWNYPPASDHSNMVFVAAGKFWMGCDRTISDKCDDDEKPLHQVTLSDFWIDRYEVSNGAYADCVAQGGCSLPQQLYSYTRPMYYNHPSFANYPVIYVTWSQASNYCAWTGKRLPTEAEWEKAARGSQDVRIYPWGNSQPGCSLANYSESGIGCQPDTTPVNAYTSGASPYGALNMAGNVMEWVADWYQIDYYRISPALNPPGPDQGTYRAQRGGCWFNNRWFIRNSSRDRSGPDESFDCDGFRCASGW